jgi:hypothetical protein
MEETSTDTYEVESGATADAPQLVRQVNRKKPEYRIRKVCYCCGSFGGSPHHIIPRSEGGLPIFDNIVWLCVPCHDAVEGPSVGARERLEERRWQCRQSRKKSGSEFEPETSDKSPEPQIDPIEVLPYGVKRMWPGGPLRQFSNRPFLGSIPYHGGGYAGAYICAACEAPTSGRRYSGPNEGIRRAISEKDLKLAWVCTYCKATSVEVERAYRAMKRQVGNAGMLPGMEEHDRAEKGTSEKQVGRSPALLFDCSIRAERAL